MTSMSLRDSNLVYRSDIDGLRALAVMGVVLTHARLVPTTGGGAGVDVFFVISGFLITSIVRTDFLQGRWSIARFYARRARRLLPALVVVLVAVNLIVLWAYSAEQRLDIAVDSATVLGFVSNVRFLIEVDFFALPDHHLLLLHTWSLAIEEQFYILYPIFLLALLRRGDMRLTAVAVSVALLLSLGLAVWAVGPYPGFAYTMLPTRAWQLLLGALIALPAVPPLPRASAPFLSGVGLAMILVTPLLFVAHAPFPGWPSLVPCVGTALVIHAGRERDDILVCRLLGIRPLAFLGRISYSLYLWHMPMLVLSPLALGRGATMIERAGIVAVTIAIAALSWRYVEMPFRLRRTSVADPTASAAALPTASRA